MTRVNLESAKCKELVAKGHVVCDCTCRKCAEQGKGPETEQALLSGAWGGTADGCPFLCGAGPCPTAASGRCLRARGLCASNGRISRHCNDRAVKLFANKK